MIPVGKRNGLNARFAFTLHPVERWGFSMVTGLVVKSATTLLQLIWSLSVPHLCGAVPMVVDRSAIFLWRGGGKKREKKREKREKEREKKRKKEEKEREKKKEKRKRKRWKK